MASIEEFIAALSANHPDDAEDLAEASKVLQKQKINTLERLAKLTDSQWQRLGLALGIEALLREAASEAALEPHAGKPTVTAPTSTESRLETEEPVWEEATDGLFQRKAGRRAQVSSASRTEPRKEKESTGSTGLLGDTELLPPENLEELWQELLEDTLPPDKRDLLQASWQRAQSASERYMLFLEYSSYLRKQEVTEEEKAERRKQLEPLLKEYGLDKPECETQSSCNWTVVLCLVLVIGAMIYYIFCSADPEAAQIL